MRSVVDWVNDHSVSFESQSRFDFLVSEKFDTLVHVHFEHTWHIFSYSISHIRYRICNNDNTINHQIACTNTPITRKRIFSSVSEYQNTHTIFVTIKQIYSVLYLHQNSLIFMNNYFMLKPFFICRQIFYTVVVTKSEHPPLL